LIHRLAAKAFIPNLENKPTVNHKNHNTHHNTHDNNVTNLEWSTYSEQNLHNYTFETKKEKQAEQEALLLKHITNNYNSEQ